MYYLASSKFMTKFSLICHGIKSDIKSYFIVKQNYAVLCIIIKSIIAKKKSF